MRKSLCRGALRALPLLVLAVFMAVQAQAVPLTSKYFSLDLPADWVVVSGPVKVQEAIQVVMGQKDHKSSALIIVGLPMPVRRNRPPRAMPSGWAALRPCCATVSGSLPLSRRA